MNDSTLTTLMGRVPARCIVLLEDLDAAFTRSTSRDGTSTGAPGGRKKSGDSKDKSGNGDESDDEDGDSKRKKKKDDSLSDVNTLSLSGLLNALDGVAAAEGRILFATTNHLERLDPALSRPGRMDVWIEFKHASPWQAEALFRNFFPSLEDVKARDGEGDEGEVLVEREGELDGVRLPDVPEQVASGYASPVGSIASSISSFSLSPKTMPSTPSSASSSPSSSPSSASLTNSTKPPPSSSEFGSQNTAYLPPPPDPSIANASHSARPLDAATLSRLAKMFADAIPRDEFSVAALQGCKCFSYLFLIRSLFAVRLVDTPISFFCFVLSSLPNSFSLIFISSLFVDLLKHKSRPEDAAEGAAEWVKCEREMRERLAREREARELKEKAEVGCLFNYVFS